MTINAPAEESFDRLRRRVLWALPTGLYVLGSGVGERSHLMTISWVTQVSMEPKLVGIGVELNSKSRALILEHEKFSLSLLERSEKALVRKFVKPDTIAGDEFHVANGS